MCHTKLPGHSDTQDVSNIHINKAFCTSCTADCCLTTHACNMPRMPKRLNLNDVGAHNDLHVIADLRTKNMPQTTACCPDAIDLYKVGILAWISQCNGHGIYTPSCIPSDTYVCMDLANFTFRGAAFWLVWLQLNCKTLQPAEVHTVTWRCWRAHLILTSHNPWASTGQYLHLIILGILVKSLLSEKQKLLWQFYVLSLL